MNPLDREIRQLFAKARQVALLSHVRPDGDAVGSVLGLGTALLEAGKEVQLVLPDGIGSIYRFLTNAEKIQRELKNGYDLLVVLDCSDLERGAQSAEAAPHINIDHHKTNLHFAAVNLVEVSSAATSQIIAEHLEDWGLRLSPGVAEALLTGILTDTIGFRTSNVSPSTLQSAARLMEWGANLPEIYHKVLVERSYEALSLWGRGIEHLQRENRLLWSVLTNEDRQAARYPGRDDAELIALLSAVRDVDVALLFVQQDEETVKVSWRARPGIDVASTAVFFGGGGHAAAAGAMVAGDLENVIERVLSETRKLLKMT